MDVTLPIGTTWIVVVDTDSYAGKFERQLAGYATGVCDDERFHGREQAEEAAFAAPSMVESLRAKSLAVQHHDFGMVTNTVRATPGRFNNGCGFTYTPGGPEVTEDARARAKKSMTEYHAAQDREMRRRLAEGDFESEGPGAWTKEACERTLANHQASIDRAGRFVEYPAFESVAMFFDEPLTAEELAFVRSRAEEFAASPTPRILIPEPFRIVDVRMIRVEVSGTETQVDPDR